MRALSLETGPLLVSAEMKRFRGTSASDSEVAISAASPQGAALLRTLSHIEPAECITGLSIYRSPKLLCMHSKSGVDVRGTGKLGFSIIIISATIFEYNITFFVECYYI